MPEKQSLTYIEAADAVACALSRLNQLIQETQELEQCLENEEREWGITPDRNKPILERMAAFGASQEAIDSVAQRLEALALQFEP